MSIPPESLSTVDLAYHRADRFVGLDDPVVEPLVVAFGVVALKVLIDCPLRMLRDGKDHLAQAFFLDRTHEAFGICIEVRRAGRKRLGHDSGILTEQVTTEALAREDQDSTLSVIKQHSPIAVKLTPHPVLRLEMLNHARGSAVVVRVGV